MSTMSPLTSISRAAVAGDSSAALSHVSFVSGFGSSCSQRVVREAAVPHAGIGAEHDLETLTRGGAGARGRSRLQRHRASARTPCSAIIAVVQPLAPRAVERARRRQRRERRRPAGGAGCGARRDAGPLRRPEHVAGAGSGRRQQGAGAAACGAGTPVTVALAWPSTRAPRRSRCARRRPRDRRDHFVRRLAAVERRDQRLHDRDGPVVGPDVAPRSRGSALRECASGTAPRSRLRTDRRGRARRTFSSASANFRSDGAVYTGLPPMISRKSTRAGVHLADELAQARPAGSSAAPRTCWCR